MYKNKILFSDIISENFFGVIEALTDNLQKDFELEQKFCSEFQENLFLVHISFNGIQILNFSGKIKVEGSRDTKFLMK